MMHVKFIYCAIVDSLQQSANAVEGTARMKQVCLRIALLVGALCCNLGAQTKEYIRLNGRVIAIESPTTSSVPLAPTNLAVTGGNGQVALSWTGSAGATSYNVKRSTTNGSGYLTINSPAATSFTDTGLTNGTTYLLRGQRGERRRTERELEPSLGDAASR